MIVWLRNADRDHQVQFSTEDRRLYDLDPLVDGQASSRSMNYNYFWTSRLYLLHINRCVTYSLAYRHIITCISVWINHIAQDLWITHALELMDFQ